MNNLKNASIQYKIFCLLVIFTIACAVSFSYRGIFSDDSRDYMHRADVIYFEGRLNTESHEAVSSFFYPLLIAVSYRLVGHTLLASHLFPFLLAVIIPPLLFIVLDKLLHHIGWACFGAVVYIFYPTNIVWLNQNLTEPVFTFWVVMTLLFFEFASERPAFFIAIGATSSFAVFTRLFDGLIFTSVVGLAVIYQCWRRSSWKWLAFALLTFLAIQFLVSEIFNFSLLDYQTYFSTVAQENTQSATPTPIEPFRKTMMAAHTYLRWYFAEKWALFPLILLICGIWKLFRMHAVQIPLHFIMYATFLLFVYGRRSREILIMRHASATIPALTILLIVGGKYIYERISASKFSQTYRIAPFCFLVILLGFFGITNIQGSLRFIDVMSDVIPATSFGQILRTNPAYPPYAQGNIVPLRENIIKEVLGDYRPSYRTKLAQKDWENDVPRKEREQADFGYHETFDDGNRWKSEAFEITGTSALWTEEHPGHLGAFPYQAGGTVVYKFSFPRKIKQVVISDIHTEWSPGDVLQMWTSVDGQQWTLRHDYKLHYQKNYYHDTIDENVAGAQTLYVKYYFFAGDAARNASDNRGASLEEFSLAVRFEHE